MSEVSKLAKQVAEGTLLFSMAVVMLHQYMQGTASAWDRAKTLEDGLDAWTSGRAEMREAEIKLREELERSHPFSKPID